MKLEAVFRFYLILFHNNKKCVRDGYMYVYIIGLCVLTEFPTWNYQAVFVDNS
jgi:hypothetical protein